MSDATGTGPMLRAALLRWPGPVAVIAIAQLFGTSLWFSANSAAQDLQRAWGTSPADIGLLTSMVQLGFIVGTLLISLSGLADRFRASSIFAVCALAGAAFNGMFAWLAGGLEWALVLRFMVGASLAGIYPLGMKLVVSWEPERTAAALAKLVGMLTLGTALPHGLRALGSDFPWQWIMTASSVLALVGMFLILLLGDGPHLARARAGSLRAGAVLRAFQIPRFRAAACGYFGHMWELYAFWTVVPLYLSRMVPEPSTSFRLVSNLSFFVIASGTLGCLAGGLAARRVGSARVAAFSLGLSGSCGLLFVLGATILPFGALLFLMLVWGAAVVADSPQFSAISARACPPEMIGSALAIQNSLGFAITVGSIGLVTVLFEHIGLNATWVLLPGPLIGLLGFWPALRQRQPEGG